MHVKSEEKDTYEKFYDMLKEYFHKENEDEEIEEVIIVTNSDIYLLRFKDEDEN